MPSFDSDAHRKEELAELQVGSFWYVSKSIIHFEAHPRRPDAHAGGEHATGTGYCIIFIYRNPYILRRRLITSLRRSPWRSSPSATTGMRSSSATEVLTLPTVILGDAYGNQPDMSVGFCWLLCIERCSQEIFLGFEPKKLENFFGLLATCGVF